MTMRILKYYTSTTSIFQILHNIVLKLERGTVKLNDRNDRTIGQTHARIIHVGPRPTVTAMHESKAKLYYKDSTGYHLSQ